MKVLELMNGTGEGFKRNKKGKKTEFSVSSLEVDPERFELYGATRAISVSGLFR
ncbi:MAG: hypothetical protein ACXVNQ_10395 [Bacteroidia bacterium]